jgi:hypothetical protein
VGTSVVTGYHVIRENEFIKNANRFVKKNQNIGKTYIYDSHVDVNADPYVVELRLAGDSLSNDTKEMLLREAESFGIMRSQIVIHEDATVKLDRFNETEIVKNLLTTNASNIEVRDDSIRVLNARIAQYKQKDLPAMQVASELQVQLPGIKSVTIAKGVSFEQNVVISEEHVVAIVRCEVMPSDDEKMRVKDWLKVRLQVDEVEIIFECGEDELADIGMVEGDSVLYNQ